MKISEVEFYLVELPRAAPHRPLRRLLVRLATSDGIEGWGESEPVATAEQLEARRQALLPSLLGRNVVDIAEFDVSQASLPRPLAAALNMGMWDAAARAMGQPLCHLWGGLFRRQVPLAAELLAGQETQRIVTQARELAEKGFHVLTLTATGDLGGDVATLAAVADAVGDRTELRLDAQQRFDERTAELLCRELENLDVQFVIDPCHGDWATLAALRRRTSTALAVSRNLAQAADVAVVGRADAAEYVVLAAEAVGGIRSLMQCVTVAEAMGLSAVLDVRDALGPGTAALCQVAAAMPALKSAHDSAYHALNDDVLSESLEIGDGMLTVPQGAGLGVDVDRAKIEQYLIA